MEQDKRKNQRRIFTIGGLLIILAAAFYLLSYNQSKNPLDSTSVFVSPYVDLDWNKIEYYEANLHTHTTASDGDATLAEVVDAYLNSGYKILAITDHDNQTGNNTTWPWSDFGREADSLGLIAIEGNEISEPDHIGSLFSDYGGGVLSEEEALRGIENKNSLAIFFHPGRYEREVAWYADFYRHFPGLVGLEIYNRDDRYPEDRKLWDRVLYELMPMRPVWGFANDDMHDPTEDLGWGRNIFLLEEFNASAVRVAMEKGQFYVYYPYVQNTPPDFFIKQISVGADYIEITVSGDYREINWLSFNPNNSQSEIIYSGTRIDQEKIPAGARFVRAEIMGESGIIYTQAFGIRAPLDF